VKKRIDGLGDKSRRYFETRHPLLSLLSEIFDSPCDVRLIGTNEIEVRSSQWRNLSMKPDCGSLVYRILRIEMFS